MTRELRFVVENEMQSPWGNLYMICRHSRRLVHSAEYLFFFSTFLTARLHLGVQPLILLYTKYLFRITFIEKVPLSLACLRTL